ncbi:MAG: TetR/AcrR family transcriptional regulator [Candidatus Thorarchaeota archaeon]|jgi:AcrR family transcriptional regulator
MSKNASPRDKRAQRERKQRRAEIIAAADKLFLERGYDNATMDQVSQEAAFSKATVYNYFPTKDDLYIAVAAIAFQTMVDSFESALEEQGLEYSIQNLYGGFLRFVRNYPQYAKIIDHALLRIVLTNILTKEQKGQKLTKSEVEFRNQQERSLNLLVKAVDGTLKGKDYGKGKTTFDLSVALSTLVGGLATEVVTREQAGAQTKKQTEQQLKLILAMLDSGLRHLEE